MGLYEDILVVLGGIGLFLIGMIGLTDGLRDLTGQRLRRLMAGFTSTPLRGVATGTVATAVIQSSSATTVTAIGFVGAGLLTFTQGIGIILGANIGTTTTGWLVAIIGFKLHLGLLALPLLFVAALLRMFGGRRIGQIGMAIAGFSLLFLGIDTMQQGMSGLEGIATPSDFPDSSLTGRLKLLLIGVAITAITQSSSAGVAAALVGLDAGAIDFSQAAVMVIGMNVGTTVTAALATIGGSTATRQTGLAHVIFNLLVGFVTFVLIYPFSSLMTSWSEDGVMGNALILLVLFHTSFNVLGVALVLPFVRRFAQLVIWLVPETGPPLLRRLDDQMLRDPAAAVDAASATIRDIDSHLIGLLINLLGSSSSASRQNQTRLREIIQALEATRFFVDRIRTDPRDKDLHQRHQDMVHALDHSTRLGYRCGQEARIKALPTEWRLRRLSAVLRDAATRFFAETAADEKEARFDHVQAIMDRQQRQYRAKTVEAATQDVIDPDSAVLRLDAIRWLQRVSYHLWRIVHHLNRLQEPAAAEVPPEKVTQEKIQREVEMD